MRQRPSVRAVDVLRIAAEVHRDPRTVVRVIKGQGSRYSRSAVDDAAKRLGIVLPGAEAAPEPGERARFLEARAKGSAPPDLDGPNGERVRAT